MISVQETTSKRFFFSRYSATDRCEVTTVERVYLVMLLTVAEVDCRCLVLMSEPAESVRARVTGIRPEGSRDSPQAHLPRMRKICVYWATIRCTNVPYSGHIVCYAAVSQGLTH